MAVDRPVLLLAQLMMAQLIMALGVGPHICVGQNIARAEGQAVLRAIAEQVDRIELLGDAVWRPNNAIHALDRMPLRLVAR